MTTPTAQEALPRISQAGSRALLLDLGNERFCLPTQQRIWALMRPGGPLRKLPWVEECVPGVNNLLLVYDPLAVEHAEVRAQLEQLWHASTPQEECGSTHEIPVDYDLSPDGDLVAISERIGLSAHDVMQLHSGAQYRVACVGSMPGFAYLVGLPDKLTAPRRASPRAAMPKGAVIIGGTQAGIMPCTAPSGWHLLGSTDVSVFDAQRPQPSRFAPGDRVVFRIREVSS